MNLRGASGGLALCFAERRFRCPCGAPDAPFVCVAAVSRELALERFAELAQGDDVRAMRCGPCGRPLADFVLETGAELEGGSGLRAAAAGGTIERP